MTSHTGVNHGDGRRDIVIGVVE